MPQCEDGYTKIANELLEALARLRMPGEARQVFDVILRKTYGFNKKSDPIALSQFVLYTGLTKISVCKAVKKLLQLGVITQKGNAIAKEYGVNKHYEQWKPLPKKVTLPKKVINVTQKGNLPLPKKDTTKETITKEKRKSRKNIVDEDFIDSCKKLYPKINVDSELQKMRGWILANSGRQLTQRFVVNWLNRAIPLTGGMDIESEIERLYGGKA